MNKGDTLFTFKIFKSYNYCSFQSCFILYKWEGGGACFKLCCEFNSENLFYHFLRKHFKSCLQSESFAFFLQLWATLHFPLWGGKRSGLCGQFVFATAVLYVFTQVWKWVRRWLTGVWHFFFFFFFFTFAAIRLFALFSVLRVLAAGRCCFTFNDGWSGPLFW